MPCSRHYKKFEAIGDARASEVYGGIEAVSERCNALASIISFPDMPSLLQSKCNDVKKVPSKSVNIRATNSKADNRFFFQACLVDNWVKNESD